MTTAHDSGFWNWILEKRLAFGRRLSSGTDADSLHRAGFTTILDLDQTNKDAEAAWARKGSLRYLADHRDKIEEKFQAIPIEKLERLANRIGKVLEDETETLYVHCEAGWGRSPTVVAAYLILRGRTLAEAERLVQDDRESIWEGIDRNYRENLEALARKPHHL